MEIKSYMLYAFLLLLQLITGIDTKKMFVARLNRSHFDVTLWDPLNFEDLNIVPGVGFHQKFLNIRQTRVENAKSETSLGKVVTVISACGTSRFTSCSSTSWTRTTFS